MDDGVKCKHGRLEENTLVISFRKSLLHKFRLKSSKRMEFIWFEVTVVHLNVSNVLKKILRSEIWDHIC